MEIPKLTPPNVLRAGAATVLLTSIAVQGAEIIGRSFSNNGQSERATPTTTPMREYSPTRVRVETLTPVATQTPRSSSLVELGILPDGGRIVIDYTIDPGVSYLKCGPRSTVESLDEYANNPQTFLDEKLSDCSPETQNWYKKNLDLDLKAVTLDQVSVHRWADLKDVLKAEGKSEAEINNLVGASEDDYFYMPYLDNKGEIVGAKVKFSDEQTDEHRGNIYRGELFLRVRYGENRDALLRMVCMQVAAPFRTFVQIICPEGTEPGSKTCR